MLTSKYAVLTFGMMFGATTLSRYLTGLILQHAKPVGACAVVVTITICAAVIFVSLTDTLSGLRDHDLSPDHRTSYLVRPPHMRKTSATI